MTESEIKALTDGEPTRIRPGSIRTSEPTGEDARRREARIKDLTDGEPERVRSVDWTVATFEERHDYPELGLRRYDGCDLVAVDYHPAAMDWCVSELDAASRGLGDTDPARFAGAIHRLRVQVLLDRAWDDLAKGVSSIDKRGAQKRVDYLNRILGWFDAQKGARFTDLRVVMNRSELLARSAGHKEADALARWS